MTPAIVLTMDAQLGLAELAHKRYSHLWPDNPFAFRIPCNGVTIGPAISYLSAQPDCEIVPSGRRIRETVRALLEGIEDRSWVFWCTDDRFPTWVDKAHLAAVHAELVALPSAWEEIKLLRWHEPVTAESHTFGGSSFAVQSRYRHWGFWHHHFVRAGVLRRVFLDPAVADDAGIHGFVTNRLHGRPPTRRLGRAVEQRLFPGVALVPAAPLVRLAEPLVEGRLTRNGLEALQRESCEVPPYEVADIDKEYAWAEPFRRRLPAVVARRPVMARRRGRRPTVTGDPPVGLQQQRHDRRR